MHFLRLLSIPFSFHKHMHIVLFPPTSSQKSQLFFLHLLSPMGSFYGVCETLSWKKKQKNDKTWGMKLSIEKIHYRRRTTGSTSKTSLAIPSLQAQHPSPTSGNVVHFQGGAPPTLLLPYLASKEVPLFLQQNDHRGIFLSLTPTSNTLY